MKKLFSILILLLASCASFAQYTTPRQTANGVYDASVTSYKWSPVVDLASATVDTIDLRPNAQYNRYKVTLVDSAAIRLKSTKGCYYGDILELDIINPAFTSMVYLSGVWVVSTGTARVSGTASKSSLLKFWFNGVDWVEEARLLNYTR